MNVKTKFALCYAAIAVLAVLALGLGFYAHDLKQKVDRIPVQAPQVAAAVKTQATKAYKVANNGVLVNAVTCVETSTATVYTCELQLANATGQTATTKFTVTWTKSTGITKVVQA